MATPIKTVAAPPSVKHTDDEMLKIAQRFYERISDRRTLRDFSTRDIPRSIIEACISAAATAPSGANCQPWHFVLIPKGPIRTVIREAAEVEEIEFYEHRASEEWKQALAPLGTDHSKPFLEEAPWLVGIFLEKNRRNKSGGRIKNYYMPESVGIATGILITALHECGLGTLTHTPSPMGFLNEILGRPKNEKPYILLVVGHAAKGARVPDISRKNPADIMSIVD